MRLKRKEAATPDAIRVLLNRPRWRRLRDGAVAKVQKVTKSGGDVVVMFADGKFGTSAYLSQRALKWVGANDALTEKYFDALYCLGAFTAEEHAAIRDYRSVRWNRRTESIDRANLEDIAKRYDGVKVPRVLTPKKRASTCA